MFRIAICDEMQPQAAELARQLQSLAGEIPLECEVEIFHSFRQLQSQQIKQDGTELIWQFSQSR